MQPFIWVPPLSPSLSLKWTPLSFSLHLFSSPHCAPPWVLRSLSSRWEEPRHSAPFATQDSYGRIWCPRLVGRGEGAARCGRWPLTHRHSTGRVTTTRGKTDIQLCSKTEGKDGEKPVAWKSSAMDGAAMKKRLRFIKPEDCLLLLILYWCWDWRRGSRLREVWQSGGDSRLKLEVPACVCFCSPVRNRLAGWLEMSSFVSRLVLSSSVRF